MQPPTCFCGRGELDGKLDELPRLVAGEVVAAEDQIVRGAPSLPVFGVWRDSGSLPFVQFVVRGQNQGFAVAIAGSFVAAEGFAPVRVGIGIVAAAHSQINRCAFVFLRGPVETAQADGLA